MAAAASAAAALDAGAPYDDHWVAMRTRAELEERTFPLPSDKEVDAAEKLLASQHCIGSLNRWYRVYARTVDWDGGHVDPEWLSFAFRQANHDGRRPGRKIGRLADLGWIDDSQQRVAFGSYNLRTGQLKIEYCGWSLSKDNARKSGWRRG